MIADSPLVACNLILSPREQELIESAARAANTNRHIAAENLRHLGGYDIAALDEERQAGR